ADTLEAALAVARRVDDATLVRAALERRVELCIEPDDERRWLTLLAEALAQPSAGDAHEGGGSPTDGPAAADAFTRAARVAGALADDGGATELYERALAASPLDRVAAKRLVELCARTGALARSAVAHAVLVRTSADDAARAAQLVAFEEPAIVAGATDVFVA